MKYIREKTLRLGVMKNVSYWSSLQDGKAIDRKKILDKLVYTEVDHGSGDQVLDYIKSGQQIDDD